MSAPTHFVAHAAGLKRTLSETCAYRPGDMGRSPKGADAPAMVASEWRWGRWRARPLVYHFRGDDRLP